MGEYAKYGGRVVKIGTCENMYYLRFNQRHQVFKHQNSLDPSRSVGLRFRLPWPDEDGTPPGAYDKPFRSKSVRVKPPHGWFDHGLVQFSAAPGYLISLPCPEGPNDLNFHRNGFSGATEVFMQKHEEGILKLICKCAGCGTMFRIDTLEDALPYIEAVGGELARRIEAGYISADREY